MLVGEFVIGLEDGEIVFCGIAAEHFAPLAQLGSVPACHTSVIYALARIGNDARGVDAYNLAIALALGTCSHGRVEGEHIVVGGLKLDSVGLETGGEIIGYHRRQKHQSAIAPTLIEGRLGGIHKS